VVWSTAYHLPGLLCLIWGRYAGISIERYTAYHLPEWYVCPGIPVYTTPEERDEGCWVESTSTPPHKDAPA
jgi:hypothetical protein